MLYGKQIAKTLEAAAGLDIEMIAPSHGVIWRTHLDKILGCYKEWITCKPKDKVLVVYDTMWDSTRRMAEEIAAAAAETGAEVKLVFVRSTGLTEMATEVLDAAAIAFGSATLNMGMMPMMGATLTYLEGLRPHGKAGLAFGSYGWGRGAPEKIDKILREKMSFEMIREPLKGKWRPDGELLAACREAGLALGKRAQELSEN
ncbi:MAG: flavodoxin domain-containing protein, partial [Planctomycetota bacterium]|jgi:flavorubredoxin